MKKKILVTGGCGFIGSHIVESLSRRNKVIVLDNMSSGKRELIEEYMNNLNISFYEADLVKNNISSHFKDISEVWHVAANPDVRLCNKHVNVCIEQNIIATQNVLKAMRENQINNLYFTSSSAVYGEPKKIPTAENYSPMKPISTYGMSKLKCEAIISAYCYSSELKAVIFRLANVIGARSSHGVIHDFIEKLKKDKNELEILGNGQQNKSYIHIDDCIEAMFFSIKNSSKPFDVFNIGSYDQIKVIKIAEIISKGLGLSPKIKFTGGKKGWKGDVPEMLLSVEKLKGFGWEPRYNSEEAVTKTVKECLNYA